MYDVRQHFTCQTVENITETVEQQLQLLRLQEKVKPGDTVALTAGSRGIANMATILKAVVDHFCRLGAEPFIVPAMGSHGGGTVAGQLKVLAGFQITEESMGVPVRGTMDTVVVAETRNGLPVHFDRFAAEADHVFVCNRVKPHTRFTGPIESGLHKMMLIGLGKHEGAKIYHRGILEMSFPEIIESVAARVLDVCGIVGGLAIVENALDQTGLIEAVQPEDFATREPELLKLANTWLPRLPFNDVDLLIVDQIGKDISGVGMDANVVGRKYNDHQGTDRDLARCRRILVRSLTAGTAGNGTGIGMAEFTTRRCVSQIDHDITRINCITGLHPEAAMIPITLPTDADAVDCALQTIGLVPAEEARVVQITNTLHLSIVRVSEAYHDMIQQRPDLEILRGPFEFPFDADGVLADVPQHVDGPA
jgi:hypothetical protein